MTVWNIAERVYVKGVPCPCRIRYGVATGSMENDYITVAREDNGNWFTVNVSQVSSAPNPTIDMIESPE